MKNTTKQKVWGIPAKLTLLLACSLFTVSALALAETEDNTASGQAKDAAAVSTPDEKGKAASETGATNQEDLSGASLQQYFVFDGDQSRLLANARDAFIKIRQERENSSLNDILPQAKCVAVFPRVAKAAILVGGSHGDGVVTCRTADGQWSNVSFLDLYKVSFGLELGVKGTDMVMLFLNDQALKGLKDGKITFGANATAVAASRDLNASTATSRGDIILYSSAMGLFAGAGLDGTYIEVDESELQDFYDESITQVTALTTYDKEGRIKEVEAFYLALQP